MAKGTDIEVGDTSGRLRQRWVKGAKLIGGKSQFAKLTNKFLTYGIQSTAYDFAFSYQDDFTNRTFLEHATIFASGGLAGASIGQINEFGAFKDLSSPLSISRSIASSSVFVTDWITAGRAKGGFNYQYTGGSQQKKTGLSLFKSLLYGF